MKGYQYSDLYKQHQKIERKNLKFLSEIAKLEELFTADSQEPEGFKQNNYEVNESYIEPKDLKKKTSEQKQIILSGKGDKQVKKEKVYVAGPFAKFYQLSNGTLDEHKEIWYYKEHKDIIGPVSSYNMDKLVYYKQITDETKVAYENVDKFKKFGKIRKIVEQQVKQ